MRSFSFSRDKNALSYWPGLILLCASVILALFCYKNIGAGWDENIQREIGRVTYEYVFNGDQTLKGHGDNALGTGFELPLMMIEKSLHLTDVGEIYFMRHLVTHFFFLFSVFCAYILALRLFKDQKIACLAFILLAFTPRMYAHSFFNSKDIPFLSAFIISFLVCQLAFEKRRSLLYLLLGIACGYASSIRAMGILLLPAISFFLIADVFRARYLKEKIKPSVIALILFISGFCAMLYASWPVLWSAPIDNFASAFARLSHISWNGKLLLNGNPIYAASLPVSYLPTWICITIPEVWLIAGITGFIWVIVAFFRSPKKYLFDDRNRNFLLYVACFIGPLLMVTALNSVDYDDWRHVYFVYPSFVMLALFAIHKLATGKKRIIIWAACVAQIGYISYFMMTDYPYQQVYFNHFVSHKDEYLRYHYDMDYWGPAYYQGMQYLLAHDHSDSIKVSGTKTLVEDAYVFMPPAERKRIILIREEAADSADYYFTNFRTHPEDYNYPENYYQIQVLNSTIFRIYKTHK